MGKILEDLKKQKEIPELKEDALKCIEVYNKIKELNDGKVWSHIWNVITRTTESINSVNGPGIYYWTKAYHLSPLGEYVYKGIQYEKNNKI